MCEDLISESSSSLVSIKKCAHIGFIANLTLILDSRAISIHYYTEVYV
jgi:hypothetical protein